MLQNYEFFLKKTAFLGRNFSVADNRHFVSYNTVFGVSIPFLIAFTEYVC